MDEAHTDDLRNVNQNDEVHLYTTEGENFSAYCESVETQHADPRSGEVRETTIWMFDTPKGTLAASIIEGLLSSEDDPEFPQHTELWALEREATLGYIETVEIHGQRLEA